MSASDAYGADAARAAAPFPPAWMAWVVGGVAAVVLAVVEVVLRPDALLQGLSDEALLVPLAMKFYDPALFVGDAWLELSERIFSGLYSALLGPVLGVTSDPVTGLRLLALPFSVVFLAGCWRIAARSGGARAGHLAVALLCVPLLLLEPAALGWLGAFAAATRDQVVGLGLGAGAALPRDLVFALLPWFWVASRERWARGVGRAGGVKSVLGPYLALGLVANLHPITAAHMALLLVLIEFDASEVRGWMTRGVAALAAFAVGASPYVYQYLSIPRGAGEAPAAVAEWRIAGIGGETPTAWAARMELVIWLLLAAFLLCRRARDAGPAARYLPFRVAGIAALLAAIAPLIDLIEPLRPFQFARLSRFAGLAAMLSLAIGMAWHWRSGSRRLVAVAGVLVVGAIVLPGPLGAMFGSGSSRGPIGRIARVIERRAGAEPESPLPAGLLERETPGDPARPRVPGADLAFREVAAWARAGTPPESLFLVPPEDFGAFRAYAARGVAITRKSGGFALTFLRSDGQRWFDDYVQAVQTYRIGTDADWQTLAERYGASHAVVEVGTRTPADWAAVVETPVYRVVRVARRP